MRIDEPAIAGYGQSMAECRFFLKLAAAAAAVLFFGLVSVFLLRAPIVVVTDAPFESLYGVRRASLRRISASLAMFRAVSPAIIVPDASPEAAVQAIAAVSEDPRIVLFPHRYRQHAHAYAEAEPGVPSVVVGGSPKERKEDPSASVAVFPLSLYADLDADLYAAGVAAAGFGEDRMGRPLLAGPAIGDAQADSFARGLSAGGLGHSPLVSTSALPRSGEAVSCLVLLPGAEDVDRIPSDLPLILFSWVDPRYAPPGTVLLIDDSLYGLLESAVSYALEGSSAVSIKSRSWERGNNLAFSFF